MPARDAYFRDSCTWFPSLATYAGIHTHDSSLETYSQEWVNGLLQKIPKYRSSLELLEISSSDEGIEKSLMEVELFETELNYGDLKIHEKDPSLYLETAIYACYFLLIRHFPSQEERLKHLLERLNQIPRLLNEGRENLSNPPAIYTSIAQEVALGGREFFEELKKVIAEAHGTLARELEKANERAREAVEEYRLFLERDLAKRSGGEFAIGGERFNRILKQGHLLDLDAEKLFKRGEEERHRIQARMNEISKRIAGTEAWEQVIAEAKKDHPSEDQLLGEYRSEMAKARAFILEKRLVPIPRDEELEVIETPPFERAVIPYAAYMPPGPFEGIQKGQFWVTPVNPLDPPEQREARLREHCYYKIPVVALHESYPGHHLQFVYSSTLPHPLMKRASSTVFCEGWAFYCEEMLKEMGYCPDLKSQLFQLKDELWRVLRVLIDVGLHTGRMTPQQAIRLLVETNVCHESSAVAEVKRYSRTPTQPMSYHTGKIEIQQIRKDYQEKMGSQFSLEEFHRQLLSCGAVPPALARKKLLGGTVTAGAAG